MATNDDSENPGGGDWFDAQGPAPAAAAPDAFAQQVTAWYQQYLGRTPSAGEIESHRGNPGGLSAVQQVIQKAVGSSGEPGSSKEADDKWIDDALGAAQSTDDASYWKKKWASGELGTDKNWVIDAINHGDGALGVRNGTVQKRGAGGNQFAAAAGFGAPPAPYASNPNAPVYEAPAVPAHLSTPYVAPTWQGGDFKTPEKPEALRTAFRPPTMEELEASPGYLSRLREGVRARDMSAAAQGTVLNGGTQKATNRYAQDYASGEYNNLFNQGVTTRGIADSEYGADVANASNEFGTNFSVFQTGVNNALAARQQNEGEYQANVVAPAQNSFANRYASYLSDNARTLNDYLTNYNVTHTAESDYWSRLKDLHITGEDAAKQRPA